jgi:hypothetical protein
MHLSCYAGNCFLILLVIVLNLFLLSISVYENLSGNLFFTRYPLKRLHDCKSKQFSNIRFRFIDPPF